jgi:hypothetical protein
VSVRADKSCGTCSDPDGSVPRNTRTVRECICGVCRVPVRAIYAPTNRESRDVGSGSNEIILRHIIVRKCSLTSVVIDSYKVTICIHSEWRSSKVESIRTNECFRKRKLAASEVVHITLVGNKMGGDRTHRLGWSG